MKHLVQMDKHTAVNPKEIMSIEGNVSELGKCRLVFAFGGHVSIDLGVSEAAKLLGFVKVNSLQAINPEKVTAIMLDKEMKTRVFVEGAFLLSDYTFEETSKLFN